LKDSEDTALASLKDALFSAKPRNILELGAGTGIVALTISALRTRNASGEDHIITTDLLSAMPLLEHNITVNEYLFPSRRLQAAVLDWDDEELPADVRALSDTELHAIVMADVTYNTSSFPALIRTLSNLVKLGTKPPIILLGYKERDPEERTLWELARNIGISFKQIGERKGAGGAPVEIWLGSVQV